MIPSGNNLLNVNLNMKSRPSVQHSMSLDRFRIIGKCDKLEAMRQVIFKILNTERYDYVIYSWNYGIELSDLFGKPVMYACPEIERRVKEALTQDDRIKSVDGFEFDTTKRGAVAVKFTVHTIFGDIKEGTVVTV